LTRSAVRGPPSCEEREKGMRRQAAIWRWEAFPFLCSARMVPSHRPSRYHCSAGRSQVHAFRVCLLIHAPVPSLPPRSLAQRMELSRRPEYEELGFSVWSEGWKSRAMIVTQLTAARRRRCDRMRAQQNGVWKRTSMNGTRRKRRSTNDRMPPSAMSARSGGAHWE
jgi:hypothetical protein